MKILVKFCPRTDKATVAQDSAQMALIWSVWSGSIFCSERGTKGQGVLYL